MKPDQERDIRDEIEFHLEEEQEELESRGVPPAEARAQVFREFGNPARVREDVRDVWLARRLEEVRQDVTIVFRALGAKPGFTFAVLLCLALGIGATTTVVSVANTLVFSPLPYPDPDRLVEIYEYRSEDAPGNRREASYPEFADWRDRSRSFSAVAAWDSARFTAITDEEAFRVDGAVVSAGFFEALGVPPRLGRGFTRADEFAPDVVVVTDRFWRDHLSADADILGRVVRLDGRDRQIVGVLPEGFVPPDRSWTIFAVMPPRPESWRGWHEYRVLGRIAPEIPWSAAADELERISRQMEDEFPDDTDHRAGMAPLTETLRGDLRSPSLALLGASGLVLLIACFNVANLLVARGANRAREISIRTALGAGRARMVRQMLTESLTLSMIGTGIGVALAIAALALLRRYLPFHPTFRPEEIRVDVPVLLLTLAVSLSCGLVFGLAPSWTLARGQLQRTLSGGGRSLSQSAWSRRRHSAIVVAETALAMTLLVGAGLLIRSFRQMQAIDPGFRSPGLATMQVMLPAGTSPIRQSAVGRELLARARGLAGASDTGITNLRPLSGANNSSDIEIEGIVVEATAQDRLVSWRQISPGYIETMGIPLIGGRLFVESDVAESERVMLINKTAARTFWPGQDPLGKRARVITDQWARVIGVVGDVRHWGLEDGFRPEAYFPLAQMPSGDLTLVVRTEREPELLLPELRSVLQQVDSSLAPASLVTMDDVIAESNGPRRFVTMLVVVFSALALTLAVSGLYAQLTFSMSRRTKELAIMMALGARRSQIVGLVMRQGLALTGIGLVVGLSGAGVLSQILRRTLFGVDTTDVRTYLVVSSLFVAVAAMACAVPAWKASRGNPVIALRQD